VERDVNHPGSRDDVDRQVRWDPVTGVVTASTLQLHPWVTAVLDEAAASKLELREYYRWVYENKPGE